MKSLGPLAWRAARGTVCARGPAGTTFWRAGPGKVGISAHIPQVEENCVPPEGWLAPTGEGGEVGGTGRGGALPRPLVSGV